jgi:hypothetical protein
MFDLGLPTLAVQNQGFSPLEVELAEIKISYQDCEALIEWTVLGKDDLSHFNVQRSTDGENFVTIGTQSSNSANGFYFMHADNGAPLQDVYYRIEIAEIDGTTKFSEVLLAQNPCNQFRNASVVIYPNPSNDLFRLELLNVPKEKGSLQIYDQQGKAILDVDLDLITKNTFELSAQELNLSPGIYVAHIKVNDILLNKRLVVRP